MEIDRLSALPEPLLLDILRRLYNTKEAARTAVLSKQWRFLWTDSPSFSLCDASHENDEIKRFVAAVGVAAAARMRREGALESFGVSFRYDHRFASDVDEWLDFAAKRRVKEVNLRLQPIEERRVREDRRYTLPQAIYSHSPLTTLELSHCNLAPPAAAVEWRSMTQLTIHEAELTQQVIDVIVSGCPVLRHLELYYCDGFSRLGIGGQSFRCLDVSFCNDSYCHDVVKLLEISAPFMRELKVKIYPRRCHLRLTDASFLEKARIDFFNAISDSSMSLISEEEMLRNSEEFLEKIWHVRSLVLDLEMIEVLSRMRVKGWRFPESRAIKELDIDFALVNAQNVSVILAMLESSSLLDKLVIRYSFEKESMEWDPTLRADLDHDLSLLKNVRIEINVYSGVYCELACTLAKILLKRAPTLEKMVICRKLEDDRDSHGAIYDEMFKKFESLLIHPRSSQKAIVEFIDIEEL